MALTVLGPFELGTNEAEAFDAELAAFTSEKQVKVLYEPYHGFDHLVERVTGSDPPEIIVIPQPGALMTLAPHLVDLAEFINPRKLRRRFGDYLIDLVSIDEDFEEEEEEEEEEDDDDLAVFGGPIKLDLKSLVWYKPAEFEAAGYTIPTTFDELVALCDRMVADGRTPFCNYIGSGPATGWVGTDYTRTPGRATHGGCPCRPLGGHAAADGASGAGLAAPLRRWPRDARRHGLRRHAVAAPPSSSLGRPCLGGADS